MRVNGLWGCFNPSKYLNIFRSWSIAQFKKLAPVSFKSIFFLRKITVLFQIYNLNLLQKLFPSTCSPPKWIRICVKNRHQLTTRPEVSCVIHSYHQCACARQVAPISAVSTTYNGFGEFTSWLLYRQLYELVMNENFAFNRLNSLNWIHCPEFNPEWVLVGRPKRSNLQRLKICIPSSCWNQKVNRIRNLICTLRLCAV